VKENGTGKGSCAAARARTVRRVQHENGGGSVLSPVEPRRTK